MPVNTAQAYLRAEGYHSALSITATQKFTDNLSLSIGKFNLMTLASRTPLIGGGGLNTFMNRAFALPSTGVSYTSETGGAGDRVVLSSPYSLGGIAEYQSDQFIFDLFLIDPRSAQSPRVIQRPFEEGVAIGGGVGIKSNFLSLTGTHMFRAAYSNASGINLDSISSSGRSISSIEGSETKKDTGFLHIILLKTFIKANPIQIEDGGFSVSTHYLMEIQRLYDGVC